MATKPQVMVAEVVTGQTPPKGQDPIQLILVGGEAGGTDLTAVLAEIEAIKGRLDVLETPPAG